ncbi:MAG: DUF7017 domain-containing protein [Bacteroidia bacterium]
MPAKEIKELRQSGKLQEAYAMAKLELEAEPDNIWTKRNLSWVLYDYVKQNTAAANYDTFKNYVEQIVTLHLPEDEKMLFDQLSWQLGKMVFLLLKEQPVEQNKIHPLYQFCRQFHLTKPSDAYSFLFKAFHKAFKDGTTYTEFADWWDFSNFKADDYQKEKLPNGKEVMATAEQAIIAYCKHLFSRTSFHGEVIFDREKAADFLPFLDGVIEAHPEYQYPPYFKAKMLLALGDQENMLSALLPFAKKKRNDFWVWDVMSEAFPNDEQKRLACYCRALTCKTSDDFLINIRQKMAGWFISHNMFNDAKTEIDRIIKARQANEWKLPAEVQNWTVQPWYKTATLKNSNFDFYKKYLSIADNLLYTDIPEETVLIEFVNTDKKIANFIASEQKFGFFKYDRFIDSLKVGDTVKVRFDGKGSEGHFKLFTLEKSNDESFRSRFIMPVSGEVRIGEGKPFGFVQDSFIHPSLIKKYNLRNHQSVKGTMIKSYNKEKGAWSWKVFELQAD